MRRGASSPPLLLSQLHGSGSTWEAWRAIAQGKIIFRMGWFKQREDGWICKHAGLPTGVASGRGCKQGVEKQLNLQAVGPGEGALLVGSMEGTTALKVRSSKNEES